MNKAVRRWSPARRGLPAPRWWPARNECLAVSVAVLIGTGAGLATRPDRTIHRATDAEVAAAQHEREAAPVAQQQPTATSLLPGPRVASDLAIGGRSGADGALAATGVPVRLTVAVLGLFDLPVRPVGVDASGALAVPGPAEAGWYQYASRPGQAGSVVVAAHVAYRGEAGPFASLTHLQAGDRVQVGGDDGSVSLWEVRDVTEYAKDDLPVDQLFRTTGDPALVLITCGGAIDPARGNYGANVVVHAVPLAG